MAQTTSRHVFISYSRKDSEAVQRVVKYLRGQGIKAWLDNESLVPGTPIWEHEIERAIIGAFAIVVILSPDAKRSEWVLREITLADEYQKRVFPVLARGDFKDSVPFRLVSRQFVDLRLNESSGLAALTTAVTSYLQDLERLEEERQTQEREAERKAAELKAKEEATRLAVQQADAERISQDRAEIDRRVKEEAERLFAQKAEEERLAKAKADAERKARAESRRKAKEEAERLPAQKAEQGRLAEPKVEGQRLAKQKSIDDQAANAKAEAERKAKADREAKAAADRLAAQKAEAQRQSKAKSPTSAAVSTVPERKPASRGVMIGAISVALVLLVVAAFAFNNLMRPAATATEEPVSAATEGPVTEEPTSIETEAPVTEEPAASQPDNSQPSNATDMDALLSLARDEGTLNVIALPHDWCNYGAVIQGFQDMYGIQLNELDPGAGSGDELEAVRVNKDNPGPQSPDVIDVGFAFATMAKEEGLIQPYKVSTWDEIPDNAKDPDGYWYGDYYGVISFSINRAVVGNSPAEFADLLKPEYNGQVALAGDPLVSNTAMLSIWAAGLSTGATGEDAARAGLEIFKELNDAGNFVPIDGNSSTVASGVTPIMMDWSYNALANEEFLAGSPDLDTLLPTQGRLAGVYVQAISAYAPHPNAAKLWMEYLYSDEGQLAWANGYCYPIRFNAMQAAGKIPADLSAKMPSTEGVYFPTLDEIDAAKAIIVAEWPTVVGVEVQLPQ